MALDDKLDENQYHVWEWSDKSEPNWKLAYSGDQTNVHKWADQCRELYPMLRMRIMKGSARLMFEGYAKNYRLF